MGYRVDYLPIRKVRRAEKRSAAVPALTAVFFLVFLVSVNLFWAEGADVIKQLLPGELTAAADALEVFAQELKAGEQLKSALEHLCSVVTNDGEMVIP